MANLLTRNPMVITSAMASSYKSSVASTLGTLFTLQVEKIEWENPANTNDAFIIIDPGSGEQLASGIAPAAGGTFFIDWTAHLKLWQDFRVDQLDSGKLYIWTR